jgi:hypothetical protein
MGTEGPFLGDKAETPELQKICSKAFPGINIYRLVGLA